ncbi:MAG: GDP-mannose 4,6-dehydratase [Cytophagaceae bacterium]|nr:GDP-mannose 4,6-dehydratase [Cytophagaceae bacterium]MDW8457242.1 GDP-mannose 4,6-dehydratase [Cytophagaceae bacterium]
MILITGVAGFIGSCTAECFIKRGFPVVGIDNFDSFYSRSVKEKNISWLKSHHLFSFLEGDLNDVAFMNSITQPVSAVIHLAAKAGVQPSLLQPLQYIHNNIQGTNNLLEWMKRRNIRKMLFASSSSVYGNNNTIPFSESDADIYPVSPYAFTKRSCELLNHTYHHLYGMDIINLRFFTVYGPRQRPDLAIYKFTNAIHNGLPIKLFGKGDTQRDYTFVDDIVQGIFNAYEYLMSNNSIFDTFNLGNNSPISLLHLVELIENVVGKTAIREHLPEQPGDMRITYASIDKAKKILNYNPSTSIEEGLKIFYQWYLTHQ